MSARDHMARVKQLPCVLCLEVYGQHVEGCDAHHIREGQGMGGRADDYLTIPLCKEHHQGATGIHGLGRRAFERVHRTTELDLLARTIQLLTE